MPRPLRCRICLLSALVSLAFATPVLADGNDTFNVIAGLGSIRDDNLFRQHAGQTQSDTLTTAVLTLSLNKPYSLQRFYADTSLIDYRYQKNDYLSYQAKNYDAGWAWSLTPRLHGLLAADRTEMQNSFVDYSAATPAQAKNVRRTENQRFTAEWEVTGGWRALAGLSRISQVNSQAFLEQSSYELDNRELGVKYVWPAGTYVQLMQREGEGKYKERQLIPFSEVPAPFNAQIDTGFRQSETEMRLYVPLTGKSALTARLARQERQHDHFPDRDYAATIGRLDYSWLPTGKLSVKAVLRRDVAAYQDYASSYYLVDGFSLQPGWQISAHTALRFKYDWEKRRFEGAIFPGLPERRDIIQSARLAFEWIPRRWVSLVASLQRDSRNSSQDFRDYRANMVNLNANISF